MTTSNTWARALLIILVVIAVVLLAMVIWPFASAFFIAAVLAGALHPLQRRLSTKLRNKRMIAAGIITAGLILAVILPLATTGAIAVKEAIEGITYVRTTLKSEGTKGLIEKLPGPLQRAATRVLEAMPQENQDLDSITGQQGGKAVAAVGGVLQATTRVVLQMAMMLIAFFFLLTDGAALVQWLSDTLPLRRVQLRELLEEFRRVSVAVLVSSVATSGVQAVVALIGYLIVRVPNAFFFALVTFFIGLIPAVGAASISLVLAILMFATGRIGAGVFLVIWGVIVVGLVDNIVKPLLIRGGLELHGAIVFFALLGGLAAFGGIGLLAGPLIIAFFLAVVNMCRREFSEDADAVPPPPLALGKR